MTVESFFKRKIETKKVIISNRFKDKAGEILPFEIKPITEDENLSIKEQSKKVVDGKFIFDENLYKLKLVANALVFPDLNSSEIQASYGVLGKENLIKNMLYAGEFDNLIKSVEAICGFNENIKEDIKRLKN